MVGMSEHSASPSSEASRQLRGHLLKASLKARDLGITQAQNQLPLTISLALSDPAGLADELEAIYTPGNPKFHQFLTPAQFLERFGPTQAQAEAVKSYLQAQGLQDVSVDSNGMFVHATASAETAGKAFQTELHDFSDSKGRSYHAPSTEPVVPAGLAIQGVHGLQNLMVAHPHLKKRSTAVASAASGSGPDSGFSPSDIKKAYGFPSGVTGAGQTLALFELDGYSASDISAYEAEFGLASVPLQNVLVDSANGSAGGGADEVTLDIELMAAIAPGASKILVYEGPNDEQGMLDVYARIANDNLAKAVSTSWGNAEDESTESFMSAENTIFAQMAAQGQTIYSAAGDSGADDDGSSLSVDDPSAQPYIVAVGGTSLTIGTNGAIATETTWSSGGGGISSVWTIPSWQAGLATSQNLASSSMRNIPDVSINADPTTGYSIYYQGAWTVYGGTSCAAPIWAALTALVNQSRANNGLPAIGFITPSLYSVSEGSRYGSDFHDIHDGSTNGYYPAVTSYDDATGWGSPNAAALIGDLSATSVTATGGSTAPIASCSSGG